MMLIYVMDDKEIIEREVHVGYINCRRDNSAILKNTIITKLGESFNKLLYSCSFNNQYTPIPNVFMTSNLAF